MYSNSSTTGVGVSVFIGTIGAILYFAVSTSVHGVNLDAVGVIMMIVGALGLAVSLLMFSMSRTRRRVYTQTAVPAAPVVPVAPVAPVAQVDAEGRPLRY